MRTRVSAFAASLALALFGVSVHSALADPISDRPHVGPSHGPLKHLRAVTGKVGVDRQSPSSLAGTTISPGGLSPVLHHHSRLGGPNASAGTVNRRSGADLDKPQLTNNGSPDGLKFTGGMGVPTSRSSLEGALSPYALPNGNTGLANSGKFANGLEAQGMHFGFEVHY